MLLSLRSSTPVPLVLALLGLGGCSATSARFPDGVLDPAQLFEIVESSKVLYEIHPWEDLPAENAGAPAAILWPQVQPEVEYPRIIVSEDGDRNLTTYPLEPRCLELLEEAEPTYTKGDYDAAGALYRAIVEQYPTCYPALAALGDSYQFDRRYEAALPWYEKTIELNPDDFIGYFFRASSLVRLGRYEEARQSYIEALARHPHRPSLVTAVRIAGPVLGHRALEKSFEPRAVVRREGEQITVYADLDTPYWVSYGLCKAVWLGEPDYWKVRGKASEESWVLREERECLLSLLVSYLGYRDEEGFEPDPAMEDLLAVTEAHRLDGFILYEIASRFHPQITLLYPEDLFDQVKGYIAEYVLPLNLPREPAE